MRADRFVLVLAALLPLAGCSTPSGPQIADYLEARALSNSAQADLDVGNYENALRSLNQVIAYGSIDEIDYARRASAFGGLRNYTAAVRDLDRAVQLAPSSWQSHMLRGVYNQRLGKFDSAIADLEKVQRLAPHEVEPFRRAAYLKLLAGHFTEAAAAYRHLRRMPGQSNTGDLGEGMALYLVGDWAGAAAAFGRALHDDPEDSLAALWYVKSGLRAGMTIVRADVASSAGDSSEWAKVEALLAAAPDAPDHRAPALSQTDTSAVDACEDALFVGAVRVIKDHGRDAVQAFRAAEKACPLDSIEATEARVELQRLGVS